ncbi:Smr/MutS family protein [Martelella sp. HB161492]|uniref:Smr/MutS family protein n=1 Tax=Martelella sp. HB161492 TaxID=2720726 RepID=UPI0015908534|nr:Smr/MutS family protein [Martelella sp. HB161492]
MARRRLTPEERALWGKVARTARPLPGKTIEQPPEPGETFSELMNGSQLPKKRREQKDASVSPLALPAGRKQDRREHFPLERPVKRKLSKGRIPIDARIDLHGLTQADAHVRLLAFISRAHYGGLRHVLVITGKGASLGSDGVLKRAVPLWFSMPEFRALISSYEDAARHHGGEGALYVRLARRKGMEP